MADRALRVQATLTCLGSPQSLPPPLTFLPFILSHTCYIPRWSHPVWLHHSDNIFQRSCVTRRNVLYSLQWGVVNNRPTQNREDCPLSAIHNYILHTIAANFHNQELQGSEVWRTTSFFRLSKLHPSEREEECTLYISCYKLQPNWIHGAILVHNV